MRFTKTLRLAVPAKYAFDWHAQPGTLRRLLPPWEKITIHSAAEGIHDGARVVMSVPVGPLRKRWIAEHTDFQEGREFTDIQISGPFRSWRHRHVFNPIDETSCELVDEIDYELPLGTVGKAGSSFARKQLEQMFAYRHARTAAEIETHYRWRDIPRMRVLVSGSTGLIGTSLVSFLRSGGHEVVRLVRDRKSAENNPHAIFWDIKEGEIDRLQLEGFDAVVHLAGAGIADHRWTPSYKDTIKESRVKSTKLLAAMLSTLNQKPKVFVSISATGYYGDRSDEILTEESQSGIGFLPEVARAWESSADAARAAGIRVVHPRLGLVITPAGGALQKMLTPFKLGVGGVVGSGKQYWSSISIHDVTGAIYHALMEEELEGPVNLVMPEEITNRHFTKTLGRVLNRPTVCPVPSFGVKMAMGELGDTLLLDSTRVHPARLLGHGYEFQTGTLEETLRQVLGRY